MNSESSGESKGNAVAAKISDLEARLAFQEDYLSAMNKRIAEQDQEIAKLQLQLQHLNDKMRLASDTTEHASPSADDRPPHY